MQWDNSVLFYWIRTNIYVLLHLSLQNACDYLLVAWIYWNLGLVVVVLELPSL